MFHFIQQPHPNPFPLLLLLLFLFRVFFVQVHVSLAAALVAIKINSPIQRGPELRVLPRGLVKENKAPEQCCFIRGGPEWYNKLQWQDEDFKAALDPHFHIRAGAEKQGHKVKIFRPTLTFINDGHEYERKDEEEDFKDALDYLFIDDEDEEEEEEEEDEDEDFKDALDYIFIDNEDGEEDEDFKDSRIGMKYWMD